MKSNLIRAGLRSRALYLGIAPQDIKIDAPVSQPTLSFVARLAETGFTVSEELLHALNSVSPNKLAAIVEVINDVMGINMNWAALVKGWTTPTGESRAFHLLTLFANVFGGERLDLDCTRLSCGCLIPDGTFPLERYTGCPFCGTPFETANFVYKGEGSKLKELRLVTELELRGQLRELLESKLPLDATQVDTLRLLLAEFGLPDGVEIEMKETAMLVVRHLLQGGREVEAGMLLKTPNDILRYLWYEKTGRLQILEPRILIRDAGKMYKHMFGPLDRSVEARGAMKEKLKLKYNRHTCGIVARWMNALPMGAEKAAEIMHPRRGMWVRMIRALRLGEYSRKPGMEHLAAILDLFYKQDYTTLGSRLEAAQHANDADRTLGMLSQYPGRFARVLFACMLRFGADRVMTAFNAVADSLPSRLLLSLSNNANLYFDPDSKRVARPVTGTLKRIPHNPLLVLYDREELQEMARMVRDMFAESMRRRFAAESVESSTIYIDKQLYNIPVSVGERSMTIHDLSRAVMGMRFPVEGDSVRLFLQWGKGLPAQHLDMDLSCYISFLDGWSDVCNYYNLVTRATKHSGDMRAIPDQVGTAEYIEISMPELKAWGAKYVIFTSNAYSCGSLSPNLVFGWMDSAHEMKVDARTGVAYDPSCVQHMIRVGEENLAKGLVCGVLDVEKREIIWLEVPFNGQNVAMMKVDAVDALLARLQAKVSIGELLELKAAAQHLTLVDAPELADECYEPFSSDFI